MIPKISVIVPIYKVEQYLVQCIESILSQTYHEMEVILVDDGSPDNCPQICDDYAIKDNRVIVIHQENGGLSDARNAGLNIARGEYISFVDSDDWLMPKMYETLVGLIEESSADIAVCNYYSFDGNLSTTSNSTNEIITLKRTEEFFHHIIEPNPVLKFEVWNKLFRRNVIGDIRFKKGQRYEDIYFDRMVFGKVQCVVYVDQPLYVYRLGRPGNTNSTFSEKRLSKFDELDDFITMLEHRGMNNVSRRYKQYAAESAIAIYGIARRNGGGIFYPI